MMEGVTEDSEGVEESDEMSGTVRSRRRRKAKIMMEMQKKIKNFKLFLFSIVLFRLGYLCYLLQFRTYKTRVFI